MHRVRVAFVRTMELQRVIPMMSENPDIAPWRQRLLENRLLSGMELLLVAAVFVADAHHLIWFSKTPYLLALGWGSLALRGVRWSDIGLRAGPQWKVLVLAGVCAGIAMETLGLFVTLPLLVKLTGQRPDLTDYRDLVGNLDLLFRLIVGAWVVAAFGEELVWRGYLMNRLADLFGRDKIGWTVALVLMSLAFGLAHAQQGWVDVVEGIIDGALLGLLYLVSGRNLLVPIVAHGVTDTVDCLIIFFGHYPGM